MSTIRDAELVPKVVKYWIQVDPETYNPTGLVKWSYFPGDKPPADEKVGLWIEVKETGKTNRTDPEDVFLSIDRWNPETGLTEESTATLEDIIRNPSGFKMDQVGLALLNKERRERGLSQYMLNPLTETFDEVLF